MERNEDAVDLIDLGAASEETQGLVKGQIDGFGYQDPAGISDD